MSNFDKVMDFNTTFGVKMFPKVTKDILNADPKLVKLRMDLIREEMKELEHAVNTNDIVETIDALADILYVVYGMGCSLGMPMDHAFNLVHESNMSKLCATEEEAEQTVAFYKDQFLLGLQPYDTPAFRKSEDGKYYVVYNASTNKILKSINYHVVDLKPLVSD